MCREAHGVITETRNRAALMAEYLLEDLDLYRARHYIGRLSSWHTTVHRVVSLGQRFRGILDSCDIAIVAQPPIEKRTISVFTNGLESALTGALPSYRGHPIITETVARLTERADRLPKRLELLPHAEVVMLEHFHTKGLSFAMGDNYIGCSKPSCYCCKLYFDCHMSSAVTGRYHGNLWMKWAVPRSLTLQGGATDRTTVKLIRRMSDRIRVDLLSNLILGRFSVLQLFDSTTGFS